MPRQWFETFFQGVVNDLWKQCVPPEQTCAEVDFIQATLSAPASSRLLDVACGAGRHATELAARGYKVTGIDISAEFIRDAQAASAQRRLSIEWICADIRKLEFTSAFDGAFSFGNSFGYLEHDDTERFLQALARSLKPNAKFLLQTGSVAECLLPHFQQREWHQVGEILFLEENHYDAKESCVKTDYTFVANGKVERRQGRQCLYTVAEISRMLVRAGFHSVAVYSSFDQQPANLGDRVLYFVAQRAQSEKQVR